MNPASANNEDIVMATFLHGLASSQTAFREEHHNTLLDLVRNATNSLETVLTANNTLQITNEFIEILKVHVTEEHCEMIQSQSLEKFLVASSQNSEIQEKIHLICMERVTSIPKYLRKQLANIILEVHESQGLGMFFHVVYNTCVEKAAEQEILLQESQQKPIKSPSDEFLSYINVIENIVTFMNDNINIAKNDVEKIQVITEKCKQSVSQNLCYNIVQQCEHHPCDSAAIKPMENFKKNDDTSRIPSSLQSEIRSEAIPTVVTESLVTGGNKTLEEKANVQHNSNNSLTASEVKDFLKAEHFKKQVRISEKASMDSEEGSLEAIREQFVETADVLKPLIKVKPSKEKATGLLDAKNSALTIEETQQSEKGDLNRTLANLTSKIPSSFQSEIRSEAIPTAVTELLDAGSNKTVEENANVQHDSNNSITASEVKYSLKAEHLKKQVRISEKASIDSEEGALEALREQFVETTDALKPLDKPQLSKENATGSLNTKNSALAVEEIHQSEKENLTRTLAEELTSKIPSCFQSEVRSEAIPTVVTESLDESGKNKIMAEKATVQPDSNNCLTASEINDFSKAEHLKKQVRIREKASMDSEEGTLEAVRKQFVETTDVLKLLVKPQPSKEIATSSLIKKDSALTVEETHQSEKEDLNRTLAKELTSKIPSCFHSEVRSEAIPTTVTEFLDASDNTSLEEKALTKHDSITLTAAKAQKLEVCICCSCKRHLPTYNL